MKLSIGDSLYYVPNDPRRRKPTVVRVVSIGRKWAYLVTVDSGDASRLHKFGRCDMHGDLDRKGYSSPGRCWPSQAAFENTRQLARAWTEFQRAVDSWSRPEGLTVETLNYVSGLLGYSTIYPGDGNP